MPNPSIDPASAGRPAQDTAAGAVNIGLPLTILMFVVYAGFILLGTFAPAVLAVPVLSGGTTTWAFVYGLFVIALGVVLTGIYVLLANRRG